MGTTRLSCGCSITTSMFGDYPILYVNPCIEHTLGLQPELQALTARIHQST